MTAPVGTYDINKDSMSAQAFRMGFKGMIGNVAIHANNEIPITANVAENGGVYSKMSLVLLQGRSPRAVAVRGQD